MSADKMPNAETQPKSPTPETDSFREMLVAPTVIGAMILHSHGKLEKQRDELLRALEGLAQLCDEEGSPFGLSIEKTARAAIASVKGANP